MSKERRTVSLEPDVDDYLSRPAVNASALVNELVSRHMDGETGDGAVMRLREEQVESEVQHLKTRVEKKREELEAIRQQRQNRESAKEASLEASIDDLEGTPRDPTNPAIQTHADRLNMSPADLVEELEAHE